MACPLFLPALPLGDLYSGECAAQAGTPVPVDVLRRCCNAGYARGSCAWAAQADADAFRFLIKAKRGGVVDVAWSSERNHHPLAVGTLPVNCSVDTGKSSPLELQARVFAAEYLRHTGR
jgi:hypothetical protein